MGIMQMLMSGEPVPVPDIGGAYQGGYLAGYISQTANGVATHGLILAPKSTGELNKAWKTSNTSTSGTGSTYDGAANTANMNNSAHPAAEYCSGLSIGGYTDWYLPALYELDIVYQNLKNTTAYNDTSYGINDYSVPKRIYNRTATNPLQTSVTIFQSGGAEALINDFLFSSTEYNASEAQGIYMYMGNYYNSNKSNVNTPMRAIRKFAVV